MEIVLKIPTMEDKEVLKALCNAVDRKYLSDALPYPYTDESAEWWINMVAANDGKTGVWRVICVDGRLVGNISVGQKEDVYHKDAEIGYMLLTEYWSKGIMTEAVKQICRLAFEKLDIMRISGTYYEPNAASGRVLEKAGFQYEGTRIRGAVKGDKIYNLCMAGLLREDFTRTHMNVMDVIHSRHSYRGKYKQIPVPRADLIRIMQAGLEAPSGCNKQTTSLIAVDDPEVMDRLHRVIIPPVGETAPAAICVLTQRIRAYRDKCFAVQDYSAAIENMLLAIVEMGYQSCWYEGHITDDDKICEKMAEILNVPDGYELVCFLPVGIAESDPVLPKKKGFAERAWFNSFPQF